jgi:hypothetical protein
VKIKSSDITVVFQGSVSAHAREDGPTIAKYVKRTRRALPNARYLLSTWNGSELPRDLEIDDVVYSEDPGALPSIKARGGEPNNVNRQIVTAAAGLGKVSTSHALKLRTDSYLRHAGFFDRYLKYAPCMAPDAVLFGKLFTVDPLVFEQLPFHMSDWFQFGPTEALRDYWSAPQMTLAEATHYETAPHGSHSTFLDRQFRCRLAVEQHVCAHYAARRGYPVPRFHNDVSPAVLESFAAFLQERVIVVDPAQSGFWLPKHEWAVQSRFQSFNCIGHADWYYGMSRRHKAFSDVRFVREGRARRRTKSRLHALAKLSTPFGRLLYTRPAKILVNRILRYL